MWSFCKKSKHTRETFFKLHGKEVVLNKVSGFRNLQSRNQAQAYNINKEEETITEKVDPVASSNLSQLNVDEISKLKSFLKTIQDGTCSLAQAGTCFHCESFTVSNTIRNDLWILDSGATDHISYNLNVFESYKPNECFQENSSSQW